MKKIEFYKHNLEKKDIAFVNKTLRSLFLTTGPVVRDFEKKFAGYLSIPEAVGITSCTGGIHLALLRHGIGPGDEVITSPMTFAATVSAIIQAGARPVFVDVCRENGLLSPEAVERAISRNTKALLPVHLYGRMVDMRGFARLAKEHNLVLIEDAAHCVEGKRDGVRPGQLSDAACFSFYATKSMTSGEGGAIVCKSGEDAAWYRLARHHGISKDASTRYAKKYEHWDMEFAGWKYNMNDIQASLLFNQIDRLASYRKKREDIEDLYRDILSDIKGLDFMEAPKKGEISGHHIFTVLVPKGISRDDALRRMQERGVGCAVNYRAVHTLTYFKREFKYKPEDFPIANEIGERTISLPLYPKLTKQDVRETCRILRKVISSL